MTIELLAEKLKELNENKEIKNNLAIDEYGYKYISLENISNITPAISILIYEIERLARELLITKEGRNNASACLTLKALGYPVVCGQHGSFGWLTGVIILPNFRYIYG